MTDLSNLYPRSTILVVEDDPVGLASLVGILGERFDLVIARTVSEAKQLVSQDTDLILLDLYLEKESGLDFLTHVRSSQLYDFVPVIITSGSHLNDDIERAFEQGASDYVLKPFNRTILGAKVRTSIDLKKKTAQLASAAFIDPLTGSANRRMFEEQLDTEWRRALRHRSELSLLLVDLDHFKAVNDTHGHQVGDLCLKVLAHTMEATIARAGDIIARLGGDEFAAILPNTQLHNAVLVAKRLQDKLQAMPDYVPADSGSCPRFTTSIGCASLVPDSTLSRDDLIRQADSELYRAKDGGGRNCVRPIA